jgi:UDP-galactose transporter B1
VCVWPGAPAASNEALRYVSFATQVLGKSCKMVPVMVGGIAAGRKFPLMQYVQVGLCGSTPD